MSDGIAQEFSALLALENAQNENNQLKERLAKAEAELQVEKRKSKQFGQLKALVGGGVKSLPNKRAKITLTMSNCAKQYAQKRFSIFSDPVELAGFQWTLSAQECPVGFLGLYLFWYPPMNYAGPYEFELDMSFRLFNAYSEKDITKQFIKKFNRGDPALWGCGLVKIKKLLDPAKHFLQTDGSIKLEADFTIKSSTLDHFFVE